MSLDLYQLGISDPGWEAVGRRARPLCHRWQLRPIYRCKRTIAAIGRVILQLGADSIAPSRIHVSTQTMHTRQGGGAPVSHM